MNNQMLAGVGRKNITPKLGLPLFGFPNPERVALSVRDPLNVTTLVLEYADHRAAILTLDLCLLDEKRVTEIRQAVNEKTRIPLAHITVSCSHTHSGPITQTVWGWGEHDEPSMKMVTLEAAESAQIACKMMQPVTIGIASTECNVGINRREILEDHRIGLGFNPWGPYDPQMTVLRIEGRQGTLASLIHYGAHPTVLGPVTQGYSRDWPGIMIDRVEYFTKAPALFIIGALGDVAPRCNKSDSLDQSEAGLQEVGSRAAMDAMRAWRSIKEFRAMDLALITRSVALPYRALPSLQEAQRELARCEPNKNKPGSGMCDYMHWKSVLAELQNKPQTHKTFEQCLTRIGPVVIVPFPGECFSEIVLRLRHSSPFQHTLCASVTNGSNGYFVTRDSLHRGGYEVSVAKAYGAYMFAENIDDVLFEVNLNLLRDLMK